MGLPAVVRPLFPRLAHRMEFGKQDPQQRDQGTLLSPREALDVELTDSRLSPTERQALGIAFKASVEAAEWKARSEVLERARYEDRSLFREFADRAEAIHEGYARRRHETAQGYMSLRHKMARWKYKAKRAAIKYGTLAVVCIVLGMIVYSRFSPDEHPRPHYQNAVDR